MLLLLVVVVVVVHCTETPWGWHCDDDAGRRVDFFGGAGGRGRGGGASVKIAVVKCFLLEVFLSEIPPKPRS